MMNLKGGKVKIKKPQLSQQATQQNLKGQTSKIQDKLQALKAEIALKKSLKTQQLDTQPNSLKTTQKSKTGTSWSNNNNLRNTKDNFQKNNEQVNKFLLGNMKQSLQTAEKSEDYNKLQSLLTQLNMLNYLQIIKTKYQIDGLNRLLQLSEDDIDKWKDIPVGYRVKVRKFINEHNKQKQIIKQQAKNNGSQDIQTIIQKRKNQRIFQPISDKPMQQFEEDIQQEYYQNQNNKKRNQKNTKNQKKQQQNELEDDQDILIQSLNSAFMSSNRRGIIKKQDSFSHASQESIKSPSKNKVHWKEDVKQFNRQTSNFRGEKFNTKYPSQNKYQTMQQNEKQLQHREDKILQDTRSKNRTTYCWNCLKKITNTVQYNDISQGNRNFCGQTCQELYKPLAENLQKQQSLEQASNNNQQIEVIDLGII